MNLVITTNMQHTKEYLRRKRIFKEWEEQQEIQRELKKADKAHLIFSSKADRELQQEFKHYSYKETHFCSVCNRRRAITNTLFMMDRETQEAMIDLGMCFECCNDIFNYIKKKTSF